MEFMRKPIIFFPDFGEEFQEGDVNDVLGFLEFLEEVRDGGLRGYSLRNRLLFLNFKIGDKVRVKIRVSFYREVIVL